MLSVRNVCNAMLTELDPFSLDSVRTCRYYIYIHIKVATV